MLEIIVRCYVKDGSNAEFIRLANLLAEKARQDQGCISYYVGQDINNPNTIALIEQWESYSHLQAHLQTGHFVELSAQCVALQEKDSDYQTYNIV